MNNEFASQLIQKNPSTVVIYNWLLFNLNETNIILQSVMNDVISFADVYIYIFIIIILEFSIKFKLYSKRSTLYMSK